MQLPNCVYTAARDLLSGAASRVEKKKSSWREVVDMAPATMDFENGLLQQVIRHVLLSRVRGVSRLTWTLLDTPLRGRRQVCDSVQANDPARELKKKKK